MSSPIADPGTLFQFEASSYSGAQGFRLPRDDLYNITVAGASGGEGVCNYHYGYGGVIRVQVRLTTDYEYLILVGHKGTSVCDVPENANHSVCQQPRPTNLLEAQACNETWYNWTTMFNDSRTALNFNGGGGGGGASMIWPKKADNTNFTDFPIVISPGGGGASAILDYEFLVSTLSHSMSTLNYPVSADDKRIYKFHTNGHADSYDSNWQVGVRGFRESDEVTSGAGGGWSSLLNSTQLGVDGKTLSQRNDFAEGGLGCFSSFNVANSSHFVNAFGGYGGGGGGCGSGGGGGGYTGGHVIANINRIPGGGGDLVLFPWPMFPLNLDSIQWFFNDGDGYIEIVASNCGCDGECVVYTEERQFECLCQNDTLLAEDGSSCYRGENYFSESIATIFQELQIS